MNACRPGLDKGMTTSRHYGDMQLKTGEYASSEPYSELLERITQSMGRHPDFR